MAASQDTMVDPGLEDLLTKVDSKFTLVSLASQRARQINSYYNQLGDMRGSSVPPQVTSTARKALSIAFEEIDADKISYDRITPEQRAVRDAVAVAAREAASGLGARG
ncbi:MAG: DNA-directed RNA polymerase subunit omega [Acidimicrobiales bacterium]|jgi:DNA-directed RNA polymerase subunit omega